VDFVAYVVVFYSNLTCVMCTCFDQCWTWMQISIININDGIKELTHGFQICNTGQILKLVGISRWEKIYVLGLLFGFTSF
jgi:hypothetical protein